MCCRNHKESSEKYHWLVRGINSNYSSTTNNHPIRRQEYSLQNILKHRVLQLQIQASPGEKLFGVLLSIVINRTSFEKSL